jgi:hypothetical protein
MAAEWDIGVGLEFGQKKGFSATPSGKSLSCLEPL